MKLRYARRALLLGLVLACAFATAGEALGDVGPVSFAGTGLAGQVITGTFNLDHLAVKTPLDYPGVFVSPPQPHLVAVGAVTGQVETSAGVSTFTDAPFVWVNISVAADCGGSVTLSFDEITGADYVGFGPISGQPLWDPSVPIPVWNPDVHWGVTAAAPLVLPANGGLACAIAQAVDRNALSVEATTLDLLLRREAAAG